VSLPRKLLYEEVTPELKDRLVQAYKKGLGIDYLSTNLRVVDSAIRKILDEAGIKRKGRGVYWRERYGYGKS